MESYLKRHLHFLSPFIRVLLFPIIFFLLSSFSQAQQFTAKSIGDHGNVTVIEVTGNYDANNPDGSINALPRQIISKEFFRTHKDEYDFLAILTNFDFKMPEKEASAFYTGVKNDTQGLGIDLFDNTDLYGSSGKLQGTIDMGNLSAIATDPLDPKFEDTLYIFSHELMHRWGANLRFKDASGNLSSALLGRDGSHWSFLLDSGGSVIYGNKWQDNKDGTFTSTTPQGQMKFFSPLDLYLMGMIDKSKVPPMLLIDNPNVDSTQLPQAGLKISGTARSIAIDDIIAAVGPRVPDASASQKSFKTAFIFVAQPGSFSGNELYGIENVRSAGITRFSVLTDGQSIMQVASTLRENIPANPGITIEPSTPRTLPPNINDGVQWLVSNQKNDGSWADQGRTAERDTAAATLALKSFTGTQTNYQGGLNWLVGVSSVNIDFFARKIQTIAGAGQDLTSQVNDILSRQNADGGWGSDRDYQSNPADTALALKALSVSGYTGSQAISQAIGYLKTAQNPDGGWGNEDKGSTVQDTSNVLLAFNIYRALYQLDNSVASGMTFLTSKQNPDGGFGNSPSTVYDTATAILSLMEAGNAKDMTDKALGYILNSQAGDGSWNESPYQTALAVNTVYKATVDPDLSIKTEEISFIPATIKTLPANAVVNAVAWNLGRSSVSQAKIALYDGAVSDAKKVGEQMVAFPGQSPVTVTFTVLIKDGNEHRFYIALDPENIVKEPNKANNIAMAVLKPEPTYEFEVLSSDLSVSANPVDIFQDVKIVSKITNIGTMNAYNIQVKYNIDDAGNPFDIATATVDIPANSTITNEITWRASKAGVNMPIAVQADPFNNFAELSEANNKASTTITVNGSTKPNITTSYKEMIIMPSPANEKGDANISALVKNEGFSAAANIVVNFYKGVPNAGGILLGSRVISLLNPGEGSRVAIDWLNIAESGERVIYIQADPDNQVEEISENDNDAFTALSILSLPDLTLSANSISFSPAFPKDGDKVGITATIHNKGEQGAGNVVVRAFEGTVLIGLQVIPAVDGASEVTASFAYDTTGKKGAHEITVTVDPDNSVYEQSEDNNQAVRTFSVQDANLWLSEQYISPNGDGVKDTTLFSFRLASAQTVRVDVVNGKGVTVRSFSGNGMENISDGSAVWNGVGDDGTVVTDGQYRMSVIGSNNILLASLPVVVDANRSPLTDAVGTKYLLNNNLSCMLPDISGSWQWFPDESGIVFNITYQNPNAPEYPTGLYTMAPDGEDILRMIPWEWSLGVDPTYDYFTGGYALSPDGEKVAFVLKKQNKKEYMVGDLKLWVVDRDGSNLTLLESYDLTKGYTQIFDPKWSSNGEYISYSTYTTSWYTTVDLWIAKHDGTGKTKIDTIADGGVLDVRWSPDANKIVYIVGFNDANGDYIIKVRVSDISGNATDLFDVNYTRYGAYVVGIEWLNNQEFSLVESDLRYGRKLWFVDTGGNGKRIKLSDNMYEFSISPDKSSIAFTEEDGINALLKISDSLGNISTVYKSPLTPGIIFGEGTLLQVVDLRWSPNGKKIAFVDFTYGQKDACPAYNPDIKQHEPYLIIADVSTKDKKVFKVGEAACYTYECAYAQNPACYSDEPLFGGAVSFFSDNTHLLQKDGKGYSVVNSETGELKGYIPVADWLGADVSLSPLERYITYNQPIEQTSACYGTGWEDLWAMSSLLNLTADLRVSKQKSAIILKGIAADLNFEGSMLEYADAKSPAVWYPVTPPSNISVVNEVFTTWIPPYEGTFYVRLTVWDKAGNTAIDRKRVSWGLSSSIINIYKTEEIFSPNGDGVKETTELHYKVVEPVHLEFNIYDGKSNLIKTFLKEYAAPVEDSVAWDGRDENGDVVPDGKYSLKVFDYEFFVEVDNTPPDVNVTVSPILYDNKDKVYYATLSGHAVDSRMKSWVIEYGADDNPYEWYELSKGGQSGDIGNSYDEETLQYLVGKKFRVTAEDYAGNRSTSISNMIEERILLKMATDCIQSPVSGCEKISKLIINSIETLETIRNLIAGVTLQYKKEDVWHDSETLEGPFTELTSFPWDISIINAFKGSHVRLKAMDILGREYYSDAIEFPICGSSTPPSAAEVEPPSLYIKYSEQEGCNLISTGMATLSFKTEWTSSPSTTCSATGGIKYKDLTYYIQNSTGAVDILKSSTVDTNGFAEGAYQVKAVQTYLDLNDNQTKEISAANTLLVDRTLPTARITYPAKSQMLCPIKRSGSGGDWYGIPIEGVVTDNFQVKKYELSYGVGENPTNWFTAMTGKGNASKPISGDSPVTGQIGIWDVTNLKGTVFSLKLKVVDVAGNVSCYTTTVSIDTLTEISNLAADKYLFSPNGDGVFDDLNISYEIDEYSTVDVKVFKLVKAGDSYVLDSIPLRTVVSGFQHIAGTENTAWDGKDDSGTVVPDGRYGIAVFATDSCGNTKMRELRVEVDNTPPVTAITYPKPGDPLGNIVEIKGTVADLHFKNYILEAVEGNNLDSWFLVSLRANPVKDDILGKWGTFSLEGVWTLRLTAFDAVGNKNETSVTIDLGMRKTLIKDLDAAPKPFSPNNDGKLDAVNIKDELTDACQIKIDITDSAGIVKKTYETTASSPGTFIYTWDGKDNSGLAVADGDYPVKLTAVLLSNTNVTQTETITVAVDSTLPIVDMKQPVENSYLNIADLTVTGSISDKNMMVYSVSYTGGAGTSLIDQGNQSRVAYPYGTINEIPEGDYTLTVKAEDLAENRTEKSLPFTIDRTPPKVVLDTPKEGEYYGAENNIINITGSIVEKNLRAYTLKYGSGDNPAQWTDMVVVGTAPANPQLFSWKVGKADGIPDGLYTLSLFAEDKAGYTAETKVKVTIDNTPPELSITSVMDGDYVKSAADIKGTVSDSNLDKYTIEISEGRCDIAYKWAVIKTDSAPVRDGVLFAWQALPPDGDYCIRLGAVDKVGNKGEVRGSVKVDTHPPAAVALSGKVESKTGVRLDWTQNTEPDLAGYNIYRNTRKINTTPVTGVTYIDESLGEGVYTYSVKAVDLAGWESEPSSEVKLKVDLTGPNANIRSPNDQSTVSGLVDLKGTAYSPDDFKQYRVYIGQGANPSTWNIIRSSPLPLSYGSLTHWDTIGLSEGVYSLKIEAEDLTGNVNSHQITVTVDNTPPGTPVLTSAVPNGSDVAVTWQKGTDLDIAGYLLYRNDQLANVSGIAIGDLKPYLIAGTTYPDKALPDGRFGYYLVAVDQAGNMSDQSNSLEVNIDTHPPHVTIVEPLDKSKFDHTILLKAESADLDIASVQFQYKGVQDVTWINLGGPVAHTTYVAYLDPAGLGSAYGDYNLRGVAVDSGGKTDPSPSYITVTYADLTAPNAPVGLKTLTDGADVSLTWTANTEADLDGYNIYMGSGSAKTRINPSVVKEPAYKDINLQDGTYTYEVSAVDTHGNESEDSNIASAKIYAPSLAQPYTPQGQMVIQITGSNAEAGSSVEIFVETVDGSEVRGKTTSTPEGKFTVDTPLTRGENKITAQATDSAGNKSRLADGAMVVYSEAPAAPTGLEASVRDYNVTLTWNANPEINMAGYNLYRDGEKVNVPSAVTSGDATASSLNYDSPSAAFDNDPYSAWMSAYSYGTFNSEWWEVALPSPELINRIEVHWQSEEYAGKDYEIQAWSGYAWITLKKVKGNSGKDNAFDFKPSYRTDRVRLNITDTTDPDRSWVGVAEVSILKDDLLTGTSHEDLNLGDKEYHYRITAIDYYGFESMPAEDASAVVGDVIPPSVPVGLTAAASGSNIVLNWSANPEPDLAGYHVYLNTNGGWARLNALTVSGTTYTDISRLNGSYTYRVTALDAAGNESLPSNEATAAVNIAPPARPLGLGIAPTPEGLNATWTYESGPVAGFDLYRGTAFGGPYSKVNDGLITASSYLDTGLVHSTAYFYVVAAADFVGNVGAYSNEASGTWQDITVPPQPVIFFPTVSGIPQTLYEEKTDIAGSAEPGSAVDLFENGAFAGRVTAQAQDTSRKFVLDAYNGDTSSLSPDGKFLAYSYNGGIWIYSTETGIAAMIIENGDFPVWSNDGSRIVYRYDDTSNWNSRVGIYEVATAVNLPLTDDQQGDEHYPSWMADGKRVGFFSQRNGMPGIWIKDLETGTLTQLISGYIFEYKFSPDNKWIAYFEGQILHVRDISTGDDFIVDDNTNWYSIDWSPDGRKLAFISYRNGATGIYAFMIDSGTQVGITDLSGYLYYPLWTADGRHIFFARWDEVNQRDTLFIAPADSQGQAREIQLNHAYLYYPARTKTGEIAFINGDAQYELNVMRLSGTFEFKDVPLTPGENLLTAVASDEAGNKSQSSVDVLVVFDTKLLPDLETSEKDIFIYPPLPLPGENVGISATVWNRGQVDVFNADVDIYLWDSSGNITLLHSERIPFLAAGDGKSINSAWNSASHLGANTVFIVVESADAIQEMRETNNFATREIVVVNNENALMTTGLDAESYQAGRNVNIHINLKNPGREKALILSTTIEDENGHIVSSLDSKGVDLKYAAEQDVDLVWNTGYTFAGSYRVHAILQDAAGILAENFVPFAVSPDIKINAIIVSDKLLYQPRENALIGVTIRHDGANSVIPELKAAITISGPDNTVLLAEEKIFTNLFPGMSNTVNSAWNTGLAVPGQYTASVEISVKGSVVSTKSAVFSIDRVATITGSVVAAPSLATSGNAVSVDYTVQNKGNADANGLVFKIHVIDPETSGVLYTRENTIDLPMETVRNGQTIEISTAGFALKTYTVLLQYMDQGIRRNIATTSFAVKDGIPPAITVHSPVHGSSYNARFNLTAVVKEDASGVERVEYQIDGGAWLTLPVADMSSGRYSISLNAENLMDGHHTITFRAADKAGNAAQSEPVSFTVITDSIPPSIAVSGIEKGKLYNTDRIPVITVTDLNLDHVASLLNGEPFSSGSIITAEGLYELMIEAVDKAGNIATDSYTFSIDKTAPVSVTFIGSPKIEEGGFIFVTASTPVVLSASDSGIVSSGISRTEYTMDEGAWNTYGSGLTLPGIADGLHILSYKSTDNAGNMETAKQLNLTIDNSAPVTTISVGEPKFQAQDGSFFINLGTPFTLSSSDAYSGVSGTEYRLNNGQWTAYAPFNLSNEGAYHIEYRSSDRLGNTESSKFLNAIVDNTPPVSEITVGTPKHADSSGSLFINSETTMTITASDSSSGVAHTEYRVDGGPWQTYEPFTIFTEGHHVIEYRSADNVANTEEPKNLSVTIDNTSPSTEISVGTPKFTSTGGVLSVTGGTAFTLSSSDNLSGIRGIEYRVDGGQWTEYTVYFNLSTLSDGQHTIYYRASDNVGNIESEKTLSFIIDNTPPETAITVSMPKFTGANGGLYITKDTEFTLASEDNLSGVSKVEYRINNGTWTAYTSPFSIPAEGSRLIEYRSLDNVGNTEAIKSISVTVDNTPPVTGITVGTPKHEANGSIYVTSATQFTLSPADSLSGVYRTEYRVDGGEWTGYAGAFNITSLSDGPHSVGYRSVDYLGNIETEKTLSVFVDNTPPVTDIHVYEPKFGTNGNLFVTKDTELTLISSDNLSGIAKTEYRIDGGQWTVYAPFKAATEGNHTIEYRSTDNVGNVEGVRTITIIVDNTPPSTGITVGTPKYTSSNGTFYVTGATSFILSASDNMSGVKVTEYRVDGGVWTAYAPFSISNEGSHLIEYRSADNVGNTEQIHSLTVIIDNTPPMTDVTAGLPKYETGNTIYVAGKTVFTLASADNLSGVKSTEYRIDGSAWTSGTSFSVPDEGTHSLSYRSKDNVENLETEKNINIIVDNTPPVTTVDFDQQKYTDGQNILVSRNTQVILASTDNLSGVKATYYRFDDEEGWRTYTGAFRLIDLAYGIHTIRYRSSDNVENMEVEKSITVVFIGIDVKTDVMNIPRVLVWTTDPAKHDDDDGEDDMESETKEKEDDEKEEDEERLRYTIDDIKAFITFALNDPDIYFNVLTNKRLFIEEFRSGIYNMAIIVNQKKPLSEKFLRELREGVSRGMGLLVSDWKKGKKQELEDVLGVKFKGRLENGDSSRLAYLYQSPVSPEQSLTAEGKVEKTVLKGGTLAGIIKGEEVCDGIREVSFRYKTLVASGDTVKVSLYKGSEKKPSLIDEKTLYISNLSSAGISTGNATGNISIDRVAPDGVIFSMKASDEYLDKRYYISLSVLRQDGNKTDTGQVAFTPTCSANLQAGILNGPFSIVAVQADTHKKTDDVPAIVLNKYGQGKTVFLSYNIVESALRRNLTEHAWVLKSATNYILPQHAKPEAGGVTLLETKVNLQGTDMDLKGVDTLEEGLTHLPLFSLTGTPLEYTFHLSDGGETSYRYFVKVKDKAGSYGKDSDIYLGINGGYSLFDKYQYNFVVDVDSDLLMQQAVAWVNEHLSAHPESTDSLNAILNELVTIDFMPKLTAEGMDKVVQQVVQTIHHINQLPFDTARGREILDGYLRVMEGEGYFVR